MEKCIDSLAPEKVFYTLKCNSGYRKAMIKEYYRHKTALLSNKVPHQFARMPFGLSNAAISFQRAIGIILSSVQFKPVMVHLEEFIVF